LQRPLGHRPGRIAAGKQPVRWPCRSPVVAKNAEQLAGQDRIAILAPFALPHADHHARAVNILWREPHSLGDAQTGRIDRHERRSQLEIAHRLEQSLDLRAGKNRRQTIRPAGRRNLRGDIRPPQGRAIEEAQRRHLHGDGVGHHAARYKMQVKEVGQQAFAVIREAIKREGMVALGKIVFTSREHVISLEPRGRGLLGTTLRYPYEVRKENEYFDDIPDEKIPKDMLDLASHIVETKAGHFEPQKFEDQYEDALKELIRKKQSGQPIERPERREPAKVINLMDALRRSVEVSRESAKRQAPSAKPRSQSEPSKKKKSR
jgi:Ku70/Ku80 beta-barrel domain